MMKNQPRSTWVFFLLALPLGVIGRATDGPLSIVLLIVASALVIVSAVMAFQEWTKHKKEKRTS